MLRGAALALLLLAVGCASPVGDAHPTSTALPIVYGADDRQELFDIEDPVVRELAREATVALFRRKDVQLGDDGRARILASSLGERDQLCPGQRFSEQPAAAFCTGTLVADDLVLTAGHCLDAVSCADLVAVFGYYYDAPNVLHEVTNEDVFACGEVVSKHVDPPTHPTQVDFAWIRLARPRAAKRTVHPMNQPTAIAADSVVQAIAFGLGIPAKIDTSGRVRDSRAEQMDYFVTNLDAFHGASGAAVYDSVFQMVGILGRGGQDLLRTDAGCFITFNEMDLPNLAREQATYAFHATRALCEASPSEPELCPATFERERNFRADTMGCSFVAGNGPGRSSWLSGVLLILGLGFRASLRRRGRRRVHRPVPLAKAGAVLNAGQARRISRRAPRRSVARGS